MFFPFLSILVPLVRQSIVAHGILALPTSGLLPLLALLPTLAPSKPAWAKPDATAQRLKRVQVPPVKGTAPEVSPARQRVWHLGSAVLLWGIFQCVGGVCMNSWRKVEGFHMFSSISAGSVWVGGPLGFSTGWMGWMPQTACRTCITTFRMSVLYTYIHIAYNCIQINAVNPILKLSR